MANDPACESLQSRLLRGDEGAWAVIYDEIVPRVRATIQGRCGPGKPWMDAEDAVHSACRTTFRRLKEGLLTDGLNDWDDVLRLLLAVAHNKIVDTLRRAESEARRQAAARAEAEGSGGPEGSPVLVELIAAEAERESAASWAKLVASLANDTERLVFQGKLDGLTEQEIAEAVEARFGGRMTRFIVREDWRAIRARLRRTFPGLLGGPETDG
jgi:DNA-directed RNA polymerase specialized sigma24 family protein